MEIISRPEAIERGLIRYFTGKPCHLGHFAERLTSSKGCRDCALINGRAYKAANKDKLRDQARVRYPKSTDYARKYYQDNKEAYKARSDLRYSENKDAILARQRAMAAANPDKVKEKNRRYQEAHPEATKESQRRHYEKNRALVLQKQQQYTAENPEKSAAKASLRRARKAQAVPTWFDALDEFVWREAAHLVRLRYKATGLRWAADHMIPLTGKTACGLHVAGNCQVIPAYLNLRKNNKLIFTEPFEWMSHV